jgi:deazaflavin-dependent oxidoreductase (nitroreductase family)
MATSNQSIMVYPAGGWRQFLFKAPVTLWRTGLGSIIGQVILLMTHTGRKSGLPRRTALEYQSADSGKRYVISAFGEKAQWYQNVMADPIVTIQTNRGTEAVEVRRVTDDGEVIAAISLFMDRNPMLTTEYLRSLGIKHTQEDLIANKDRFHIITFEPTDAAAPPPQEIDLKWIWWVVGAFVALRLLTGRKKRK